MTARSEDSMARNRGRAVRHWLSGTAVVLFLTAFRALPTRWAMALGRSLGRLAARVDKSGRRRSATLMHALLPACPADDAATHIGSMYAGLGQLAAEVALVPRLRAQLADLVDMDHTTAATLKAAQESPRGLFFATGHFGAWELLPHLFGHFGFSGIALARAAFSDEVDRFITARREMSGMKIVARERFEHDSLGAARTLLKVLKRGDAISVLCDQDTDVPSAFVPFFGRPAKTPRIVGDLWARRDSDVIFVALLREGGRYRLVMHPVTVTRTGDKPADAIAMLTAINQAIEACVRRAPGQWVWLHRRFKSLPPV